MLKKKHIFQLGFTGSPRPEVLSPFLHRLWSLDLETPSPLDDGKRFGDVGLVRGFAGGDRNIEVMNEPGKTWRVLPSGQRLHSYGKSWKITIFYW